MVGHGRTLLHDQGVAAGTVATAPRKVNTPDELLQAITDGIPHIELRQHMDLSSLTLLHASGGIPHAEPHSILGELPATVQTIRVSLTPILTTLRLVQAPHGLDGRAADLPWARKLAWHVGGSRETRCGAFSSGRLQ